MTPPAKSSFTAFAGTRRIASGTLGEVALKVKEAVEGGEKAAVLIFDNLTSEPLELDIRGPAKEMLARLEKSAQSPEEVYSGPGRPKLGVVGREVTLLPRHWAWLNSQPGGASVTLRKLVEAATAANVGLDRFRAAQEATYRFMVALAGNLPGFEEATRALFAKKKYHLNDMDELVRDWPTDVRRHVLHLMQETLRAEGALAGAPPAATA